MKRIVILLAALMLSSAVFGQRVDGYGIPVNNIDIQVSDATGETFVSAFAVAFAASASAIFKQDPNLEMTGWIPFLSAGYEYHFADTRWNVGGEAGYWHIGARTKDTGVVSHNHLAVIAASGKIYYKPRGICKLYGGVNLGLGVISSSEDPLFPAFQVNPIGMRLGNERVAFLLELGVGYRGIVQAGVTFGL